MPHSSLTHPPTPSMHPFRFLREARRHYYVTPTSYLELLQTYKTLLSKRQTEVMTAKKRCVYLAPCGMYCHLLTRVNPKLTELTHF